MDGNVLRWQKQAASDAPRGQWSWAVYECIHLVSNIFFYAILEENVLGTTIFIMMRSISALAPPARQLRILMPSLMLGWKRKLVPAENFVWRRVAADELSRSNGTSFSTDENRPDISRPRATRDPRGRRVPWLNNVNPDTNSVQLLSRVWVIQEMSLTWRPNLYS